MYIIPNTASFCVVIENIFTDFPVKREIVPVGLTDLTDESYKSSTFENGFTDGHVSFVDNRHGWTLEYIIQHIYNIIVLYFAKS